MSSQAAAIVTGLSKRLSVAEMARKLGVTESAVRAHRDGSVPREKVKERYRALFDVPVDAWGPGAGEAVPLPVAVAKGEVLAASAPSNVVEKPDTGPPAASAVGEGEDARKTVVELLAVARSQLARAESDALSPYRERAQLITACTGLCRLLARLSGQFEVTETAIVRSRPWARAMGIVGDVLAKYPEAAAELAAALDGFAAAGDK